jgi:trehalose 6-phosphate phosphatase
VVKEVLAAVTEAAPNILVGLDFDGTLAPLAPTPEAVHFPPKSRELLREVSKVVPVAMVSGRKIDDLRRRVDLPGLIYAGNHGLEIETARGRWVHPAAARFHGEVEDLCAVLQPVIRYFPGARLENKHLTLSLHYRNLSKEIDPRALHEVLERTLKPYPHLRLSHGKKVWEIRPKVDWDKGRAIRRLLAKKPGWTAMLVGDDMTDEEGFKSLGPKAITVRVGQHLQTHAKYFLKDVPAVLRLLSSIRDCVGAVKA